MLLCDMLLFRMAMNHDIRPQHWDPMSRGQSIAVYDVPNTSKEYIGIQNDLVSTSVAAVQVQWIHRVQNKLLWKQYSDKLARMYTTNGGIVKERLLFHGSPNFQDICGSEDGLDMRLANPGVWGRGNYFAERSDYSHTYTFRDGTTSCYVMILAKVLIGVSFNSPGNISLTRPPPLNNSPNQRYDSVSGMSGNTRIFITYSNDLSYPAYLICYKMTNGPNLQGPVYVNPLLTLAAPGEDNLFDSDTNDDDDGDDYDYEVLPPYNGHQPSVNTTGNDQDPLLPNRQRPSACCVICGRCFIVFFCILCLLFVSSVIFVVAMVLHKVHVI